MADNDDQLAALGQQVLGALLATYNPKGDPELALAILPGQVLGSGLVNDGVVNPLPVSRWLHDQYDDPLLLRLADGTPLPTPVGCGIPATAVYTTIARWAQPVGSTDAAGYARVSELIATARQDLGADPSPDVLTLGCEPDDFAADTSTAWTVFDTHLTSQSTTTTTGPAQQIDPALWKVRALPATFATELPQRREAMLARRAQIAELTLAPMSALRTSLAPAVAVESPAVAALPEDAHLVMAPRTLSLTAQPVREFAADRMVRTVDPRLLGSAASSASESEVSVVDTPVREVRFDPELLGAVTRVQLSDIVTAPAVSTVTTTSDLHVHFEHCLVTLTRNLASHPWWHPELVADDGWYVPGMTRGELVAKPPDPTQAHCLPQALLLVRDVSLTGEWTADALATMSQPVPWFGPFLMAPSSPPPTETATATTDATQQTTVLGAGTQVIGVLCTPLPVLPPCDDPSTRAGGGSP